MTVLRHKLPHLALVAALTLLAGCKAKTVDDATLSTNVRAALAGDPSISQQPIQTAVVNGVVTLTGNVSDDTAKSVAGRDAATVKGVKEVVDNMTVNGVAVTPTITTPAAPSAPRPATRQERQIIASNQPLPPPASSESAPPPPPQPIIHNVTVPSGTPISVRITETLDSAVTQTGTPFNGVVIHSVVADGLVAIPAGSAVSGTVVEAKDATHFKGSSLLSIALTSVRRHGVLIPIQTDAYAVQGKGRGTNTAEKIGGGAAVGAILGGIFGGGKGAAIGAAAGGGGGAAVQGFSRGQQVQISSETPIRFALTSPITIRTSELPSDEEPQSGLQQR